MQHQLALLAAEGTVYQNGSLRRVPIVNVMRGELEVPLALARVRIERRNRTTEQMVTFANISVEIGGRIAGAQAESIGLRGMSAGHQGRSDTSAPTLPFATVIDTL